MELIPEEVAKKMREAADRVEKADAIRSFSYVRQPGARVALEGPEMPETMVPSGAFALIVTWYEEAEDQREKPL